MAIIPALVYILTTSGSIHLTRYSLEAIGDSKKLLSIGWRPCLVSTITTAIGMLSLARSGFPAIRSFGFFCATGAVFALIYQLIAVPWLLQRFGGKGQRALAGRAEKNRTWLFCLKWHSSIQNFDCLLRNIFDDCLWLWIVSFEGQRSG